MSFIKHQTDAELVLMNQTKPTGYCLFGETASPNGDGMWFILRNGSACTNQGGVTRSFVNT